MQGTFSLAYQRDRGIIGWRKEGKGKVGTLWLSEGLVRDDGDGGLACGGLVPQLEGLAGVQVSPCEGAVGGEVP